VYRCADDRWVAVSAPTDDQVAKVLTIIGRADEVARWGRAAQRVGAEADALDAAVAAWIATQSRDAVLAALLVERLPAAPVSTLADLAADPHVAARGSLDTAVGGAHPAVPDVGEHTAAVLAEWLG
jgi:crotonobetainyl-CoA:carnitine CoA-transferase CaiB-like acyl-CoA transferase